MNPCYETTNDQPSEMMDIHPSSVPIYQPDDAPKTLQEVAHSSVDSVMGTPAPDGAADTSSASQVQASIPAPHERVEPESIEGMESVDTENPEVTDISSIQKLFASYAKTFPAPSKIGSKGFDYVRYFDPARMTNVRAEHAPRLEKAKVLAAALLEHYYPKDQGYRVEPAEFPLLQFGGWRTWVYPENCYAATKRKGDHIKGRLKKNVKPMYETWGGNITADKFHRILPEHIAGYVVLSEVQYEDGSTGWAQHTYLAIMIDDLDTFEHWVPEKLMQPAKNFVSMPRADILNDAMGSQAGLATAYAIIMLGPRFEFYNYQAKPAWEEKPWEYYLGPDPEDADHDANPSAEEETSCFSHLDGGNGDNDAWMVDIRSDRPAETLAAVDTLFKSVVGRDVEYRGGYTLPGPMI